MPLCASEQANATNFVPICNLTFFLLITDILDYAYLKSNYNVIFFYLKLYSTIKVISKLQ